MNSNLHTRKKLIRLTAHSCTLGLLKGQLGYLQKEMDVILVAKDLGDLPVLAAQEGTEYRDVNMQREISPVKDLKSLWTLIRLFRKEKPDIVHANTPKGALLGLLAAWITRVPHRIYNVNGLRFETATGNFRRLLIMMERVACACANKVIPQSNGVADVLRREHVTNKPLKVILNGSGNGVDILRFNPEDPEVIAKAAEIRGDFKGVAYVFMGRLVGDKGVNELVEAFERLHQEHPDTLLHLLGHLETKLDPLKPETLQEIEANEAIIAEGQQKDVRPYLKASDVMVHPSYREGFPNVVLEAAAMGLPCIASDVNGAVDAIQDGMNGFVVPKRDAEALYQAMKRLYEDADLRHQMAERARPFIASHFNRPDVWKATLEMYRNL
jgi:glycosyltransferase involved in cell wall biosynthesis